MRNRSHPRGRIADYLGSAAILDLVFDVLPSLILIAAAWPTGYSAG